MNMNSGLFQGMGMDSLAGLTASIVEADNMPISLLTGGILGGVGLLSILCSILFVKRYNDPYEAETLISITSILILSLTGFVALLVPLDISLVSAFMEPSGIPKPWATAETITSLQSVILILYYANILVIYSILWGLTVTLVPFAYFYFEAWDGEEELAPSASSRACTAFKYTAVFTFLAAALLIAGYFLSVGAKPDLNWDWFRRVLSENNGERIFMFTFSVVSILGLVCYVFYSGYGMANAGITLLRRKHLFLSDDDNIVENSAPVPSRDVEDARAPLLSSSRSRDEIINDESLTASERMRAKYNIGSASIHTFSSSTSSGNNNVNRRTSAAAPERSSNRPRVKVAVNWLPCIPLKLFFGVLFVIISGVLVLSILLTSIDRAAHSFCGVSCGFIIDNSGLFNPINSLFKILSVIYPADVIAFGLIMLYMFGCTAVGIISTGVRLAWMKLYSVRPRGTLPQGVLLITATLFITLLAIIFSVFWLSPTFATYANTRYCSLTDSLGNRIPCDLSDSTHLIPCTISVPTKYCPSSVISTLVGRVLAGRPWAGMVQFIGQWIFCACFVIGCIAAAFKPKVTEIG